ncbi:hypothetical protein FQV39_32230 (plasmid) [Bosea sp. F3-2]|uniref:hypothetical protein n=1 Tax=unclassified Bosea (in: a-proteobacteria) TaxID=2653178 RepID=UPI0011EF7BA4|nr:hypothetical protein [Bosea sp. F3-2]MCP4559566.1 hypothetical protein [Bosea sp. (in: a-proteobacteria)]MCP4738132.1 hypothetical protein [Bosea sp. (in: a-proteobacteria)]QEL27287.1 hypothetical protein FQV39_32230 [Bosea sp. F3-2]
MLAQRRVGRSKRRSSILSLQRRTSGGRHGRDLVVLREMNRTRVHMITPSADLIDDDFDELDCSAEVLLQLANQL